MKWLSKLIGKRRNIPHRYLNQALCKYHDQHRYPDLLETEHCRDCDMSLCYICSHAHIDYGCQVHWDYPLAPSAISVLDKFNAGYKTQIDWEELKCSCGQPWAQGTQPTICIACGTATCSDDCHLQLQDDHLCLFFTNLTPTDIVFEDINGFRAILLGNIEKVAVGQRVSYASPRFMNAVKNKEKSILIQRGFRQYGIPGANMLERMSVVEDSPSYEHRICQCDCDTCSQTVHPVYNCMSRCLNTDKRKFKYIECWCMCSHCIMLDSHTRKDCHFACKFSALTN